MSEQTSSVFNRMGAALNESLSTARTQWTVFAAGFNVAIEQAAASQRARVEAAHLGLASEKAEAIVAEHLERARTTPHPMDWDAVRRDMVAAATGARKP